MLEVALYAAATGGALLGGAALGCLRTPPTRLTAGMLAFGSGAMVVSVAFDLFRRLTDRPALRARPLRSS